MRQVGKGTTLSSLGLAALLTVVWVLPATAISSDEAPAEIVGTARVQFFLPAVSAPPPTEISLLSGDPPDTPKNKKKKRRRRKSIDLFRHDTHFTFRDNPMVLRVRLRAKKRETMSVELKF